MKHIAILVATAFLAGCAGMQSGSTTPYYDQASRTVMAPGFPVERIRTPAAHFFAGGNSDQQRRPHARAGDAGSANTKRASFAWTSEARGTSVLGVDFLSVGTGSEFLPMEGSHGYDLMAGNKVLYSHRHGRYDEIIGIDSLVPDGAPECALATDIAITSKSAKRRVVATYAEGIGCDERLQLSGRDLELQRTRAYIALDL